LKEKNELFDEIYAGAEEIIRVELDSQGPLQIKVLNKSNNDLPIYETSKSAGVDLKAFIEDGEVEINPGETVLVKTGLHVELPDRLEMQIRSRSGLALKKGIIVLNSPATIDPDYRGDVGIILHNLSNSIFVVKNGDRIAQAVFAQFERIKFKEVNKLSETERGEGGFGHTGGVQ
jgi:dUTP pyrophosphatase